MTVVCDHCRTRFSLPRKLGRCENLMCSACGNIVRTFKPKPNTLRFFGDWFIYDRYCLEQIHLDRLKGKPAP